MFMGSRHAPYPAFDAIMESWGGHNNGTTSNDRTNYYEIGPRNLLETFLWLEADRLATLPDVITDEELEKQLKVVPERAPPVVREPPLRPRRAGDSRRRCTRPTTPTTGRPSARTTIWRRPPSTTCARSSIASTGPRTPAWWWRATSIRPRRARSSNVTSAGSRSASRRRVRRTRRRPRLTADVEITLTDRVQLPRLRLAWHTPALFAPGDADLDLAAHVLGGGKSSRLYRALVFERRIAQDVFAYQGSQMLGSLFHVGATAKPDHDLDRDRRGGRRRDRSPRRRGPDRGRAGARAQHAPGRLLQEPRSPADAGRSAQPLPEPARRSRRRRARRRPLQPTRPARRCATRSRARWRASGSRSRRSPSPVTA